MTLAGILWLVGMGLIFIAEQIIGTGTARWVVDALGLIVVIGSFALRARGLSAQDPSIKRGTLFGLAAAGLATASLVAYALSTSDITNSLGLIDESADRWMGVWSVLTPIVFVLGALPMFSLDMVLSANPTVLPRGSERRAALSGLSAGLAIALIFPANFLANHYNVDWDTAYFRTATPGDGTRSLVAGLSQQVDVYLFFPTGNDVLAELRPYFDELEASSGGMVKVSVHDQALDLALAEELKLQDNGWVVFKEQGEPVKFKLRLEVDKARRDLRQLDSLVQKNLLRATRGQRVAYTISGHGEASQRGSGSGDWRKLSQLRRVLQSQSYRLEDLGLVDGLADQVPADADLLILAAPTEALTAEETQSINTWMQAGGQLLVLVDAESDPLEGLLSPLGLRREPGRIADDEKSYPGASKYLIVTDRYGTHSIVGDLNKANQPVVLPAPVGLSELPDVQTKRTALLRTFGSAYADLNANGRQDADEKSKAHTLAYAVQGGPPDAPWRAVVVGNLGFTSDAALKSGWVTGPRMLIESTRWLAGDEDFSGETSSEEDVRIDHSPDGQRWWFWGTIFAVPLIVLGGGFAWVTGRRRLA